MRRAPGAGLLALATLGCDLAVPNLTAGQILMWDGRFFVLRQALVDGRPSIKELELVASDDGIGWRHVASAPVTRSGGVGQVVPGTAGLLQLGSDGADAVVWLVPWPIS